MDREELRRRVEDLQQVAKSQMGRVERFGVSGALGSLAQHLGSEEQVEFLFGAQIDGKQAVLALTDRRLLATVEIEGSGVSMKARAVARKDALLAALGERRQRATQPAPAAAAPSRASDDPADLLERLGELHQAGVLTDEEFQSKKAELLDRM